jgi:hypothetical protein
VTSYLATVNHVRVRDNNWLFFRVLVNRALALLDAPHSDCRAELDRIDDLYRGDGWYSDGEAPIFDYYGAFALHFYGLVYAAFGRGDQARARTFKARAAEFAPDFAHWFDDGGAAVPYGRSVGYRFAQGAFWAASALADVDTLGLGTLKGLLLRHLRWWLQRPIASETGVLTIGYGYPSTACAESYMSPASPYWALKAFSVLALPASHRFWAVEEESGPARSAVRPLQHPRMLICRSRNHVVALCGGQTPRSPHRHFAEKYAKFCYSSRFGFSVPVAARGLGGGAHDSMLAVSDAGDYFRVRDRTFDVELTDRAVAATWRPWDDVEIRTWLIPAGSWHVRVHRLRTCRSLVAAEGGFALALGDDEFECRASAPSTRVAAEALTAAGASIVCNLHGDRSVEIVRADSHTNIVNARTVIPTLLSRHDSGEGLHWLACCVIATMDAAAYAEAMSTIPSVTFHDGGFVVTDSAGALLYRISS